MHKYSQSNIALKHCCLIYSTVHNCKIQMDILKWSLSICGIFYYIAFVQYLLFRLVYTLVSLENLPVDVFIMDSGPCHLISMHTQLELQIHPSHHVYHCWQSPRSYCTCAWSGQLAVLTHVGGDGGPVSDKDLRLTSEQWSGHTAASWLRGGRAQWVFFCSTRGGRASMLA